MESVLYWFIKKGKPFDVRKLSPLEKLKFVSDNVEKYPLKSAISYFIPPSEYLPEAIFDPVFPKREFMKYPNGDPYDYNLPLPKPTNLRGLVSNERLLLERERFRNRLRAASLKPLHNLSKWKKTPESVIPSLLRQYDLTMSRSPSYARYKRLGGKNLLDLRLIMALIGHESGFDPNARGVLGDAGLMQLLPASQKELRKYGIRYGLGVIYPSVYDPDANIRGGIKWLLKKWLEEGAWLKKFKDVKNLRDAQKMVLQGYNSWGKRGEEYAEDVYKEFIKMYGLPSNYNSNIPYSFPKGF